ncbi:hypothetical protein FHT82_003793 [Rhizobium sp. BK275]|uniref:DUF2721 domain-containing protein n=1 Tax=unclassified Rhizobium TaxID=2613769 RepID=UPI001607A0B0|nr:MULTISPECIES: DUF2721 domain-containing protein [unclassified Rhizobium]MBB3391021.1 hypothetical protein [Rhizobium sp. BK275]MBB3406201.1 hypothetical protein [Rhizobium sp. BK316]
MLSEITTAEQISRVISQATAPAFLLGAVAGFISVLITRMHRIVDRSNVLSALPEGDPDRRHLIIVLSRLKRRAKLLNRAIEFAVISGICTTLLVILAFASSFLSFRHEYGAGIMFSAALLFFAASLLTLLLEVRAALHDLDFYV